MGPTYPLEDGDELVLVDVPGDLADEDLAAALRGRPAPPGRRAAVDALAVPLHDRVVSLVGQVEQPLVARLLAVDVLVLEAGGGGGAFAADERVERVVRGVLRVAAVAALLKNKLNKLLVALHECNLYALRKECYKAKKNVLLDTLRSILIPTILRNVDLSRKLKEESGVILCNIRIC